MIIAYQDTLMHLCPAERQGLEVVPKGCLQTDDSQLEGCFNTLVNGHEVWVWLRHGFRPLLNYLHGHYRFVKAAGGLVVAPGNECLMIYRQGRWDLPKGMVEPGETLIAAARREVEEETGISVAATNGLITKTYHIFDKYGGWHLKQTSWYAMQAPQLAATPQTEEEITQAVWVPAGECLARLESSFASLRLVAQASKHIL